ncbi:MAG: hypothetical protein HQ564_00015 [Candidatus Saganbacteria bacterium]|nr:hypothetical protein [Candidatus Saganbacteria bacterium]
MKKAIVLLVILTFVVGLVSMASAVSASKIRAYIGLLNRKLTVATRGKNWARVNKLKAMIAVQNKRLAVAEGTVAPPPPVVVPPPPSHVSAAPAGALFGWGLDTAGSIGYVAGKSMLAVRGDVILPDPLGLGPIVGLPAESVVYKVGLGYATGKDGNDADLKAIPLFVDGVILLPADLLGGIESYLGGGLNYLVYRSGQASGSLGGEIYYGIQGDLGLGISGKSFAQVGYTILRTADTTTPRSAKGVSIDVGHSLTL